MNHILSNGTEIPEQTLGEFAEIILDELAKLLLRRIDEKNMLSEKESKNDFEPQNVSVKQAAKEIGVSADEVRERMKNQEWDLGEVISPKQSGSQHYRFLIFRPKLDKFLGKG